MTQQECWGLYEKQHDGHPIRIRLNEGIEDYVCHPRYVYQLTISVPLNVADEEGYPFPEENKLLDELELVLKDRLETHQVSVFVAVITTEGYRLYILYTYMPDFCEKVIRETDKMWIYHSISLDVQEDKEWAMVEGLL